MKTIWKYTIEAGEFMLRLPQDHKFISAQMQGKEAKIWALVDPDSPMIFRKIKTYGTGSDVTHTEGQYIGTWQFDCMVFHTFALDE